MGKVRFVLHIAKKSLFNMHKKCQLIQIFKISKTI